MNGRLIRQKLLDLELSDEAFAAALDVSMSTVQNMKRGRPVRLETADRAAKRLGIGLSELLTEQPATGPPKRATG